MPFRFTEEWLGCLDFRTGTALWQCCNAPVEFTVWFVFKPNVDDSFYIDGYEFETKMRDAFVSMFQLVPGEVVVGEETIEVYFLNPFLFDLTTCLYVTSFLGDLSNAPCTQVFYPPS